MKILRRERFGGLLCDQDTRRFTLLDHPAYLAELNGAAAEGLRRTFDAGAEGFELPADHLASPLVAFLEITSRCNSSCIHCYASASPEAGLAGELDGTTLVELIGELARIGCFRVRLTGGEPTLRPDLPSMVAVVHEAGMIAELNTNGLFDEGTLRSLLDAGVGDVRLSLEGPAEIDEAIRGAGHHGAAVRTLAALCEARHDPDRRLDVTINVVLMRRTRPSIRPMIELAAELGCMVSFGLLRQIGRASEAEVLTPRDVLSAACEAESVRRSLGLSPAQARINFDLCRPLPEPSRAPYPLDGTRCIAGTTSIGIDTQGRVVACNYLKPVQGGRWVGESVLGVPLLEIWQRSEMLAALRRARRASCKGCPVHGRGCNGGCLASAALATGDIDGVDPYCVREVLP
jgi:radical SAM protein with 4Fe4S-binding SPASM domain